MVVLTDCIVSESAGWKNFISRQIYPVPAVKQSAAQVRDMSSFLTIVILKEKYYGDFVKL